MSLADVAARPLEYRKAQTLEVRHPERLIELIAVPYDEETRVMHHGRWITETVAPGSFANVRDEDRDIRVNRGHDLERPLGRVVALHPNDRRGLRAAVKIVKTPAGDEVLELAGDDLLGASVGFAPYPGGEDYSPDRTQRRITSAFLGHIALTGDPAYQGAKVLSVRTATEQAAVSATPLLDAILTERRFTALGIVDITTPGD